MNLEFIPIEFENETVVITDPCYLLDTPDGERPLPDGVDTEDTSTWEYCGFGFQMEKLGVERYATKETIYGDWSCTVYEFPYGRELGKFCADAGLVTVIPLSEVLRFNPRFLDWLSYHEGAATLIPNFTGKVAIIHGDRGQGAECWVEGRGSVDFVSKQTGF